jgi:hypothetical protein
MNWRTDLYERLLRMYGGNSELLSMAEVQALATYASEWRS